jgi:hypothetical protein
MWTWRKKGRKGAERGGNVRKVEVAGLDVALLVVIRSLQDRTAPFADQALCDALDAGFGSLAPGVEVDNFADAAAQEDIFVNGELGKSIEDVPLNIVGREAAVVQWLEEVLHRLEEVGFGIEN